MTYYFFDTSALTKRYITEKGSTWVRGVAQSRRGNTLIISRLTATEVMSVFRRQTVGKVLTPVEEQLFSVQFRRHLRLQYALVKVDDATLTWSLGMIAKHSLKALDAIQLASALEAQKLFRVPITFVAADAQLLTAAVNEGLPTDNPELYP